MVQSRSFHTWKNPRDVKGPIEPFVFLNGLFGFNFSVPGLHAIATI